MKSPILLLLVPIALCNATSVTPSDASPIDALNTLTKQLSLLTADISSYKGNNPVAMERIIQRGQDAIKLLHDAGDAYHNLEGMVDGIKATYSFLTAGLALSVATHSFCDAIVAKQALIRSENNNQLAFAMLDHAYQEARYVIAEMKLKLPSWAMSTAKPFLTELLGSIGEARETYRPTQEEVDLGQRKPSEVVTSDGGRNQVAEKPNTEARKLPHVISSPKTPIIGAKKSSTSTKRSLITSKPKNPSI